MIRYQGDISQFIGFINTALRESGFGEEIELCLFVWKQVAPVHQGLQHTGIYLFVRPLAFAIMNTPSLYYSKSVFSCNIPNTDKFAIFVFICRH